MSWRALLCGPDGLWSWCLPDKVELTPHQWKGNWLFVSFGESQSAVLDLADWIARRPCSERHFPDAVSSKAVNVYPITHAYGLVREEGTSLSNHVTKSDDEPILFTSALAKVIHRIGERLNAVT